MDDFIDRWRARAIDEALAHLSALDESPYSDGILRDWIDELCRFPVAQRHVAGIVALIGKADPHLQEAGLALAADAIARVDCLPEIDAAIARLFARDVDSWVLEAILALAHRFEPIRFVATRRALAGWAPSGRPPSGRFIMRNRYIQPLPELRRLFG